MAENGHAAMTPKDALIEKMARAAVVAFGHDPDELVPATGYDDAPMIPRWYQEWEFAARYWVFRAAYEAEHEEPTPTP